MVLVHAMSRTAFPRRVSLPSRLRRLDVVDGCMTGEIRLARNEIRFKCVTTGPISDTASAAPLWPLHSHQTHSHPYTSFL